MSAIRKARTYVRKRLARKVIERRPARVEGDATESAADLAPRKIEIRGAGLALQECTDPEILFEGPAGTGKTVAALQKCYQVADRYPGARVLIMRQVKATLAESVLATFERYVLPPTHPEQGKMKRENRRSYPHINGSIIVCAGLDKPDKILSTDWDLIYFAEALEASEEGFETLIGRLRGDAVPYQQIIADCNPGHPKHFLNVRAGIQGRQGTMTRLKSRHEDNPRWHDGNDWTEAGKSYIAKLMRLTGARRRRYLEGEWAASEGVIYGEAIYDTHWVKDLQVQDHWRRIWVIDFGYYDPFVWWEVVINEEGIAYRHKEIYHSNMLVEDAAQMILDATKGEPRPEAIICDHDAEGRATLEKHLGMPTIPAIKSIRAGIDAVKSRLRVNPNGKPSLMFCVDSLVHDVDEVLAERKAPTCSDDEFAVYEWDPRPTVKGLDRPKAGNDHGMDVMRYAVAYLDGIDDYSAEVPLQVHSVSRNVTGFF